jgi:hypothetical protein
MTISIKTVFAVLCLLSMHSMSFCIEQEIPPEQSDKVVPQVDKEDDLEADKSKLEIN